MAGNLTGVLRVSSHPQMRVISRIIRERPAAVIELALSDLKLRVVLLGHVFDEFLLANYLSPPLMFSKYLVHLFAAPFDIDYSHANEYKW